MDDQGHKSKPRRVRFSLRSLFVILTAGCIWLAWQANSVHERKRLLERISTSQHGRVFPYDPRYGKLPWTWSLLGARPVGGLCIEHGTLGKEEATLKERDYVRAYFPEANGIQIYWSPEKSPD